MAYSQQLLNIQYNIIHCGHHAVPYILRTHSSYNWKLAPFDPLHPFHLLPHLPPSLLETTTLLSASLV